MRGLNLKQHFHRKCVVREWDFDNDDEVILQT